MNTWLHGIVLDVISQRRNASSKRATTYVKASYRVGDTTKIAILPLQVLKDKDPRVQDEPAVNNAPAPLNNLLALLTEAEVNNLTADNNEEGQPPPPPPPTPPSTENAPASINHGRHWYEGITDVDMNGPVPYRSWKMICQYSGRAFTNGCDLQTHDVKGELRPYDFFMACFPKEQLRLMVEETNASLRLAQKFPTTVGEILKWFGITILITRFEFADRASLWSADSGSRYIPAPNLGTRTGMPRERYNTIMQHLVWSKQPPHRDEGMSSETYRWMLVSDFVKNFNDHRKKYFSPSSIICVDESISRWYGLGGHWINMGLPMYVAFDRKPEDGCEIQNACCGKSGIMMQLCLVRTAAGEVDVVAREQQQQQPQQPHEAACAVADTNG